jgi:hypothetical protein
MFAPGDLSLLADGTANLTSIQTSEYITRLGPTTLTIETASTSASVPGPLPALGAAATFGFSRKLRKRSQRGVFGHSSATGFVNAASMSRAPCSTRTI